MTCILKHPVTLSIQVMDVADQLALGYDVIEIHRSSSGKTGLYAEITTADTRPALEAQQTVYGYTDENGSPSYWYKFRYRNDTGPAYSAFSSSFQVEDPALAVCSIEELKTFYLFGIDLTDDAGRPMPDSLYQHYIIAAVDALERMLDIPIRPIDVEEQQDYYRGDYDKYIWVEVNSFPVIEVEEIRLVLPGEQVVQVFNREWIHVERWAGQIQLVPGTGTAGSILLGASGAWIPLIYGNNRYIPNVFRIKYRAGFGPPSPGATNRAPGLTGPVSVPDPKLDRGLPQDIKHAVGMIASLGPFNIAGDLLGGAGIASQNISVDGLAQGFTTTSSATNAGFGAPIIQYQKDLKKMIPEMISYYKGIRLRVI